MKKTSVCPLDKADEKRPTDFSMCVRTTTVKVCVHFSLRKLPRREENLFLLNGRVEQIEREKRRSTQKCS